MGRLQALAAALLIAHSLAGGQILPATPKPTGAEPLPPLKAADAKPAEIPSYAPDQIFSEIETTERELRDISGRSESTGKIKPVQDALPQFSSTISSLVKYTQGLLAKDSSLGDLNHLQANWSGTAIRLGGWQSTLQSLLQQQEKDLHALRFRESAWRKTLGDAPGNELPTDTIVQLRRIAAAVTEARNQLLERRNVILSVRNQVSQLQIQVDGALEEIEKETAKQRADVLRQDSSPVWSQKPPEPVLPVGESKVLTSDTDTPFYLPYIGTAFLMGMVIYGVLFVLLSTAAVLVRRRCGDLERNDDPNLRRLSKILQRPFSAGAVLTVMLGLPLVGKPQDLVSRTIGILLLVPVIRLVPSLVSPALKSAVYLLAALYATAAFAGWSPSFSGSGRWISLILTITSAVIMARYLRGLKKESLLVLPIGVVRFILGTFFFLTVVAGLLNIFGYVTLGQNIAVAVIRTLYSTLVIDASVLVSQSFLSLSLQRIEARISQESAKRFEGLKRRLQRLINWSGGLFAIVLALSNFRVWTPTLKWLTESLATPLRVGAIQLTIRDIFIFVSVILVSIVLSGLLRLLLEVFVFPRLRVHHGSAQAVSQLLNYAILFVGFLVAASAAGIDMSKFTFIAGALGVGLGFGLQNVVNNFVSGVILLFERPVHVGDRVTIRGGVNGIVSDIGIRASTIRTWDGADVVVPNGDLLANDVTNWTLTDTRRRSEIQIGIGYGSNPKQVIELLVETAKKHPKIDRSPAPFAWFTGFGESALNFVLFFWTYADDAAGTASDVRVAVKNVFQEAGVQLPYPQRDINIRTEHGRVAAEGLVQGIRAKGGSTSSDPSR